MAVKFAGAIAGETKVPKFLISGPDIPAARFLCAHGAGAGMETSFLATVAALLAERGIATHRFEFAYMSARREGGPRKPPPRAERLTDEYRAAVAAVPHGAPLIIGGKSMGGRVASLVADDLFAAGRISGLACLGYPFHPPNKPEQLRTAHLEGLACPALIVQGERDPFGTRAEVEAFGLSSTIRWHWASDGDHDLGPRGASGFTRKGNLAAAADAIEQFARALGQAKR
jgi:predicted alpha/beta-hydrolase family hydrolase